MLVAANPEEERVNRMPALSSGNSDLFRDNRELGADSALRGIYELHEMFQTIMRSVPITAQAGDDDLTFKSLLTTRRLIRTSQSGRQRASILHAQAL